MEQDSLRWQIVLIIMVTLILGMAMFAGCQQTAKTGSVKIDGPHIVLKLKPAEGSTKIDSSTLDNTVALLKKRLHPLSLDEWKILPDGKDRIVIGIPEKTDVNKVTALAGKRGYLEYREKAGEEWKKVMDGSVIESAQMESSGMGTPVLTYVVKQDFRKNFEEMADRNENKLIGIYLDGNLIDSPQAKAVVNSGIGILKIDTMSREEAGNLVIMLNSGALPAEVEIVK